MKTTEKRFTLFVFTIRALITMRYPLFTEAGADQKMEMIPTTMKFHTRKEKVIKSIGMFRASKTRLF